jgi:hypothetical protein
MKFFPYHWRVFSVMWSCCIASVFGLTVLLLILPSPANKVIAEQFAQSVRHSLDERNQADLLVQRTIQRLALGDAFDAKLRQRTWVYGYEVVGIGHYEQSGGGTGRYSLEMTIHDGDQRHTNQQISDGKLAWIRTHLGPTITLRRIDLGRIDEFYRELSRQPHYRTTATRDLHLIVDPQQQVPPWMRVGGLIEVLEQIAADYDLKISKGFVDQQAVWILRGIINDKAEARMTDPANGVVWSERCPYEVRLAIAAVGDQHGFGVGLPCRIEFWGRPTRQTAPEPNPARASDELTQSDANPTTNGAQPDRPAGNLISLLEIYSVRRIEPSPEERFRFEREDREVNFFNDTRHYLQRITDRRGSQDPP